MNRVTIAVLWIMCCAFSLHGMAQSEQETQPEEQTQQEGEPAQQTQPLIQQVSDADENLVKKRMEADLSSQSNPYSFTQHRLNYLLPFSYQSNPNQMAENGLSEGNIDHFEAKFQISIKMPVHLVNREESTEGLYFGFTAMSLWQVYNSEISKPFRETNYEPELFYNFETKLKILGYRFNLAQIGINHQSNGQNQLRSRSWNRLYGSLLFSDETSFYYLKAWYRFKEDEKEDPLDPQGDDNPDITHYLGHFELGYGTRLGNFNLITLLRNNFKTSDNKGSIEVNLSYPISDRYEILLQYFNGYGDSLIDYNRHQQRISLGVQLAYF
ncbi:phospholipase A [Lacimicrobium sp. SS2-24]|uniref:phospholipase A n=1 Tax=Lacimicrobium sp. SS2-24 TaxID=2005569 RepID=UPI000B4BEE1E|nr:phospholipase A [Lacimicrobium sp. SS2-24]